MDLELIALLASFGGGVLGAAIGGQPVFILTGFAVVLGSAAALAGADYDVLGNITFGPILGPHTTFVGGVAAAAYAARKGDLETGRDIATPSGLSGKPDVLLVGGAFGVAGYLCNQFLLNVLDGATYSDTIAITVFLGAIAVRLMLGRSGLFGNITPDVRDRGRMSIGSDSVWVSHQGAWSTTAVLGAACGFMAAYAMITIARVDPELAASVRPIIYGFSAVSLLILQFGQPGPVTHHMTLSAAVAASTIMLAGGSEGIAMVLGVVAGVGAALFGELAARVFLIHGDTHIDPPAIAIFIVTSIVLACDALF